MLRRFAVFLCFASLVLFSCLIVSCGGSSSSGPKPCTGGPFNVQGDWQANVTANGVLDPLVGVINASGEAAFFDSGANIATLSGVTGACSYSGTLTLYASDFPGPAATATGTAFGNFTSATAFTGGETTNGIRGSVNLNSYAPLTGSVNVPTTSVSGLVEGQINDSLTALVIGGTSSGITYSGTDLLGCTVGGTFTEEGTNNAYDVTYDISGNSPCAGNFTGVGFESNSDLLNFYAGTPATGTYLYAIFPSSSGSFVVEIYPPLVAGSSVARQQRQTTGFLDIFNMSRYRAR